MSGTSLDGIDAAVLTTDGQTHITREGFVSLPYDNALRARIRACLNNQHAPETEGVARDLTLAHAQAVKALLAQTGMNPAAIDLIGFHGQTIAHAPERGYTCQLGDGELLMRQTGIAVVNDFRSADVAAGGQGAPLAPVYHMALAGALEKPVAFLNIGGVANITYIDANGAVLAFDTGAGNALIDDWMLQKTGCAYDDNGQTAARGTKDEKVLRAMTSHPFFAQKPPKSLDRDAFVSKAWAGLSLEDGAATLTAFTVAGVEAALLHVPHAPKRWIVSGGGRRNGAIMKGLAEKLRVPVVPIEEAGYNGDAIEAEAFAYMAVRSVLGLPISFASTTGVPRPMTGGRLHPLQDAA